MQSTLCLTKRPNGLQEKKTRRMRQHRPDRTLTPCLTKNVFCSDSDLVPTGSSSNIEKEDIPKSMTRVLNAAKIREEYRRKRKRGEDSLEGDDRSGKRQKPNAEEKSRGKGDRGTLVVKVCRVGLKATAKPDSSPFAAGGDTGAVQ